MKKYIKVSKKLKTVVEIGTIKLTENIKYYTIEYYHKQAAGSLNAYLPNLKFDETRRFFNKEDLKTFITMNNLQNKIRLIYTK